MITEGFELADYACSSANSRGRAIEEKSSTSRTEFQRDRDRIIHSSAFRRLEYKTQVFVNHEGDLFRTRLTHTLEVAQIARTTATLLKINPDLTEAIALAHDLGHTPFGHSGQTALDRCMADHGGFEHNLQSLRIVDLLEDQYPNFDGLNLTWETREGILKHCSRENALRLGALGERFLKGEQPSLEASILPMRLPTARTISMTACALATSMKKTSSKTFRCTPNTMRKSMRNIRIFRSAASKRKW